eukprot:46852-Rhodomonas_salina.1
MVRTECARVLYHEYCTGDAGISRSTSPANRVLGSSQGVARARTWGSEAAPKRSEVRSGCDCWGFASAPPRRCPLH